MKRRIYIALLTLLATGALFSPLLKAQYVFTQLDLLGTTRAGGVSVSGNSVLITYFDSSSNPSSFLYSGNKYTLIDDVSLGRRTLAGAMDSGNIVGAVQDESNNAHGFIYNGGQYTALNFPSAKQTVAVAVSGSNIIGDYEDSGKIGHGFLYNNGTFTDITFPTALKTGVNAISGSTITGTYEDSNKINHGFVYSSGSYISITYPGALKTVTNAISGSNIIGIYKDTSSVDHGFLYNGGVYSTISYPSATKTVIGAVDGNNVIGGYQLNKSNKSANGFLYSNGTYTSIVYPGSAETYLTGISGNNIVGTFINSFSGFIGGVGSYTNFNALPQGFIYNISTGVYTTLDVPGARRTAISGISGNNIVGGYQDINFVYHGFLASPATRTLSLGGTLAFGSVAVNATATNTLTITNTGNSPVTVSGITYPAGFSGSFTGPIGPGSTQKVTVTFAPTATTSYGGSISVVSNATGSPSTIPVSGTGIAAVGALVGPTQPVTFNQWLTRYSLVGGSTSTPQNDGIPTLLKYLFDINPTAPLSSTDRAALPAATTTTSGGTRYLALTYRHNALVSGVTINVETSTDLQTWTTTSPPDLSQQIGTDPSTGDPIMEVGVKANGTNKQFIRLNVTQP